MALWKKKKEEEPEIDPAVEREMRRRREQWERLQKHMSENPLFHQTTFDGLFWIDPFTGQKINAPFDWQITAREHFTNSEHWRKSKTKSMAELRTIKWLHHLGERFWNDERYRLFAADGRWFNPCSETLSNTIVKQGSVIPKALIVDMGKALALEPKADPGRMKPLPDLLRSHPELASQEEIEEGEVTIESGDFSIDREAAMAANGDTPEAFFNQIRIDSRRKTSNGGDAPSSNSVDADPDRPVTAELEPEEDTHEDANIGDGGGFHDGDADLQMASRVQQQLLGDIPDIPNIDIALHYEPFHFVGGDFYDFIELKDGRWFTLLGDVAGHGVQAALVVQSIIKTLRFICQYSEKPDLLEIMCTLNDSVKGDLVSGQFFTCFAGIIDPSDPEAVQVECVCCGHHPSIITNPYSTTFMRSVGIKGMGVGLSSGKMMAKTTRVDTATLGPGDCLFVWTDGICEAMNPHEEEFGDWRTRGAAIAHADRDIDVQVDHLIQYVLAFTGGERQDDMSALAIRVPHPDDDFSDPDEEMEEDEG